MSISISGNGSFTGATADYSFDQSVGIAGTLTYEDVASIDSVGIITARSGINVGPLTGIACTISSTGAITAAAEIQTGGNPFGGLPSAGVKLNYEGAVVVARDQSSVFIGKDTNTGNTTSEITFDGTGTFATEVVAGVRDSQGIFLTSAGAAESWVSSSRVWNLGSNGTITATGNIVSSAGNVQGFEFIGTQSTSTFGVFKGKLNNTVTTEILADGTATFKNKLTVQVDSPSSVDTVDIFNGTSGGDNRVKIRTFANGGGDPYLFFDGGGSNFVVGEEYNGTTSNKLCLGTGANPSNVTGITINGLGKTVIGSYTLGSEQLRIQGDEADIWLDSSDSGIWRIMGSSGGNTHLFRVYDNTNSGDRLTINASGRIRLPGVPGVAGSNLANLQIESDGNLCTTTSIRAAKTNISPLADTSWLFDLNPVTFNWRTKTENEDGTLNWGEEADGGTQYGLIAEEVEEVKDDFCYYNNDGELSGVHYDRLVAPLIKAIQEQQEQIETLKSEVQALKGS